MSTDRALAHGRAAHAALAYLNGRRVKSVSMSDPPVHFGMPEPKTRQQAQEAIRLLLAPSVGAMLHVGGEPRDHVTREKPEVAKAIELAGRLPGDGDAVDKIEPVYESLLDTLGSPRIWAGVSALAAALLAYRAIPGERAAKILADGMSGRSTKAAAKLPAPTRRITILGDRGDAAR
jgi:hypothetical protein